MGCGRTPSKLTTQRRRHLQRSIREMRRALCAQCGPMPIKATTLTSPERTTTMERNLFKTPPFIGSYVSLWKSNDKFKNEGGPKFGLQAIWTPAEFTDAEKKLWNDLNAEI